MISKMQARQKHKKSAFSKLPPISRGPSAETEKFEHTGGPGSYVKSPSQRSTSPQQKMTHNMMTRSKTRAAARAQKRAQKRAEKAAAARRNANDDPNRITDIKLGFINKEILTKFLSGDGDERKLNKISVDDMFEIEFYYVKSYSQTWNEMIWNCSDYDFHWRNMRYNTSSCVAAIMCDVDNDEEY